MPARAQTELERGDTAAALDDVERAATMRHAADAELGLIRAAMQAGAYRRALAFCAHTAGEHLEDADAGALHAWLLRVGGQSVLAERVLAETRARLPDAPVPMAVARAFAAALPVADGALRSPPHRMAPWPTMPAGQPALPALAHFASGAVPIGDGRLALLPAKALPVGGRLWVRNGTGATTEAVAVPADPALAAAGLAVLTLRATLPLPDADAAADAREPFAASPGFAVLFAETAEPAWPSLRQGFFGGSDAGSGLRRLGIKSPGADGAAVLDARGRLVGIGLSARPDGAMTWLPAACWQALDATARLGQATAPVDRTLTAPDLVYEAGLRRALQVLAEGPASQR